MAHAQHCRNNSVVDMRSCSTREEGNLSPNMAGACSLILLLTPSLVDRRTPSSSEATLDSAILLMLCATDYRMKVETRTVKDRLYDYCNIEIRFILASLISKVEIPNIRALNEKETIDVVINDVI